MLWRNGMKDDDLKKTIVIARTLFFANYLGALAQRSAKGRCEAEQPVAPSVSKLTARPGRPSVRGTRVDCGQLIWVQLEPDQS